MNSRRAHTLFRIPCSLSGVETGPDASKPRVHARGAAIATRWQCRLSRSFPPSHPRAVLFCPRPRGYFRWRRDSHLRACFAAPLRRRHVIFQPPQAPPAGPLGPALAPSRPVRRHSAVAIAAAGATSRPAPRHPPLAAASQTSPTFRRRRPRSSPRLSSAPPLSTWPSGRC